jgi:hypothetical protein
MKRILFIATTATTSLIGACNSAQKEKEAAQQRTIDSMRMAMERQHIVDSINTVAQMEQEMRMEEEAEAKRAEQAAAAASRRSSSSASRSNSYAAERRSEPTVVYQDAPAPAQQQRKGWSNKATGAAIGAGVGAITGAIISKKKGTGAIIGGASGAAVGLGTGAIIDESKKRREERQQR